MIKRERILEKATVSRWLSQDDKVIIYSRGNVVFAFNFNPAVSFEKYFVPTGKAGTYGVILNTDSHDFGGFGRVNGEYRYKATPDGERGVGFYCYLPARSAVVFKRG